MRREARGTSFLAAQQARRKLAGNCPRCGRPSGSQHPHGKCEACKAYVRHRKATLRAAQPYPAPVSTVIVDPRQFYRFEERVRELEERMRWLNRHVVSAYARGYANGVNRERKRWSNMPRDWSAWGQRIGVEEARRQTHRMPTEEAAQ